MWDMTVAALRRFPGADGIHPRGFDLPPLSGITTYNQRAISVFLDMKALSHLRMEKVAVNNDPDNDWLDSVMDRTSVTVDEAVYMLLGWEDGPVITKTWSDTPTEFELEIVKERNARPIQLDEASDFVWACREGEYKDAKRRRRPAHVIAEKRAAMEKFPDEVRQAKAYLCAIKDELNEGDSSALRIDRELSKGTVQYITRTSFERWAQDRCGISLVPLVPSPKGTAAPQELPPVGVKEASPGSNQKPTAKQKLRAQEQAILDAISGLELNPKCLQRNVGRQHGAKFLLRTKLKGHVLFPSQRVFDKAWERMLGSDIAYAK